MSLFPSDEEFNQCVATHKIAEGALDWGKLPTKVVYRVVQPLVPVEMQNGSNTLLQLVNRENEEIRVWAPRTVVNNLKVGMKLNRNDAYIMSLGQKERKVGVRKRKYFDFEAVFLLQQQEQQQQQQQQAQKQPQQKRPKLKPRKKVSLKDLLGEETLKKILRPIPKEDVKNEQ